MTNHSRILNQELRNFLNTNTNKSQENDDFTLSSIKNHLKCLSSGLPFNEVNRNISYLDLIESPIMKEIINTPNNNFNLNEKSIINLETEFTKHEDKLQKKKSSTGTSTGNKKNIKNTLDSTLKNKSNIKNSKFSKNSNNVSKIKNNNQRKSYWKVFQEVEQNQNTVHTEETKSSYVNPINQIYNRFSLNVKSYLDKNKEDLKLYGSRQYKNKQVNEIAQDITSPTKQIPIPIPKKRKFNNIVEQLENFNVERSAVILRRLEYATSIKNKNFNKIFTDSHYEEDEKIQIELIKSCLIIQNWWRLKLKELRFKQRQILNEWRLFIGLIMNKKNLAKKDHNFSSSEDKDNYGYNKEEEIKIINKIKIIQRTFRTFLQIKKKVRTGDNFSIERSNTFNILQQQSYKACEKIKPILCKINSHFSKITVNNINLKRLIIAQRFIKNFIGHLRHKRLMNSLFFKITNCDTCYCSINLKNCSCQCHANSTSNPK